MALFENFWSVRKKLLVTVLLDHSVVWIIFVPPYKFCMFLSHKERPFPISCFRYLCLLNLFLIYICFSFVFFVNRCSSGNDGFTHGRPSRQAGWQLYSTLPIILGESPSEKVAVEYLPVSAAISIIVKSIFQWVCGIVFPWKSERNAIALKYFLSWKEILESVAWRIVSMGRWISIGDQKLDQLSHHWINLSY